MMFESALGFSIITYLHITSITYCDITNSTFDRY
jgi:hypothetical protein